MLKKRGLINPKETKRRVKAARSVRLRATRELKVADFGDLVQFDSKHFNLPWGDKRFQITAIDVLGKRKISRTYSHLSSRKARDFFLLVQEKFPFQIKRAQSDNGSEFAGEFDDLLQELGIPHYFIYPNCPKQNSCVERAIQTDLKEFYQNCNFADTIEEQNRLLEEWDETYNSYRPHQAIGYLTPDEFYQKRQSAIIKPLRVAYLLDLSAVYHVMNQNTKLTNRTNCINITFEYKLE
jgi:transposase InsO family protein